MEKPIPDIAPGPNEGRLDSWKKIAGYLKRDITTVQRWEKREGMPVHRQLHDKLGSIYAFRTELDAWMHGRRGQSPMEKEGAAPGHPEPPKPPRSLSSHPRWVLAAIAIIAIALGALIWMDRNDYFWRNPLAGAVYQPLTGFDGENEAAAISRDGQFVAFLSDRGGRTDVWVTQVGSGQFHNLTAGVEGELVNPSIRTLGFSPDGTLVTFWLRQRSDPPAEDISVWAVPTLGGRPRPYLEGVAEAVWSPDGNRLAYHTPLPGDPLFVAKDNALSRDPPILIQPSGLHGHFPVWAPEDLIYFVKGTLPDQLDIWRISLVDKLPQRLTSQPARLSYPVLLDRRTLLYLASAPDGSGPWVYGMDVRHRVPHRLTTGVEQYTSLAASADGHRVIATVSEAERTLWRVAITETSDSESSPTRISLATGTGFAPRLGPGYLLYIAEAGTGDSIWKLSDAAASQIWSGSGARIIGGPAISADGQMIAFSLRQKDRSLLYAMAADGSRTKLLSDSLELRGSPAFAPDGLSVTTAADERGVPHLFRVPLAGAAPTPLVQAYSVDPTWSPDGRFVIYSGRDIGTQFAVEASTPKNATYALPQLILTRGARHIALLPGARKLVFLQGDLGHKNLWTVDLSSGATHQLTHIPSDFDVRDFDVSPDGREAVLERAQARSRVVAIDRPPS